MKKFLFILLLAILSFNVSVAETKITREGNTFVQTSTHGSKGTVTKTKYQWKDSKGTIYDVYMSSTGSCFVNKISSKTGKEYRYYLGPEISEQICRELGVEYKGKKSTSN